MKKEKETRELDNIIKCVKEIIAEELKIDIEQVGIDALLIDDLQTTFLDIIQIVQKLENKFDINILDQDVEKFITVFDIINSIYLACMTILTDFKNIIRYTKKIIASQLKIDVKQVIDNALLIDGLGAGSSDIAEIIKKLEEELDIEISDEDSKEIINVLDIIDCVYRAYLISILQKRKKIYHQKKRNLK